MVERLHDTQKVAGSIPASRTMFKPKIIYEDKNFLALDKPAGLLVHKTKISKEQTLVDWLLKYYPDVKNVGDDPVIRPGIVHRLDRNTSGVILVARNQKYFEYLKNLFQIGQIKKTYLALACGEIKPKIGIIKKPISLKANSVKRTVWKGKMEKEAITEYKVLNYFERNGEKFSLAAVMPKTGRTHQIRIHLASIGHPIVGDNLYGQRINLFKLNRLFLHAESLEFPVSEGRKIKIEAELPEELSNLLRNLENP